MRKALIISAIVIGLSMASYGVYTYYKKQIYLAMHYCYKIADVKIVAINKERIALNLFVKFQNNSNFDIEITNYNVNIIINGVNLSQVNKADSIRIYPKAISQFNVGVDIAQKSTTKVSAQYMIDLATNYLLDKSRIIIRIQGDVTAKVQFIEKTVPIDMTMTLAEILAPSNDGDSGIICEIN